MSDESGNDKKTRENQMQKFKFVSAQVSGAKPRLL